MSWRGINNPNYKGLDKILTNEFLIEEYIIKKKSMIKIGKENNCGKKRIGYYLRLFNIPIRSINQAAKNRLINPKNHFMWNGGITQEGHGYILIHSPNHPFKKKNNYVLEHRLVMEKYLGRYLTKKEVVHHKGIKYPIDTVENKQDNMIENLQLFNTNAEHIRFHKQINIKYGVE